MAALREDVQSAYLDITEFTGQSLTGPRELITRRVLCSNVQQVMSAAQAAQVDVNVATVAQNFRNSGGNNPLQQLNFRILSTSPGACLNAKIELVCPMYFHHAVCHDSTANADIQGYHSAQVQGNGTAHVGKPGWMPAELAGQVAPRRNGLLKACNSITSTVNSTVSFTFHPDQGLDVMEQIFTQPGAGGQTGVYNDEEGAAWGNTDGCVGAVPADALAPAGTRAGLLDVRNWYNGSDQAAAAPGWAIKPNKGFIERRADFRSGGGAAGGGVNDFSRVVAAAGANTNYVKYDYRTTVCIPPFKTFSKDIYCRTPTFIPYLDSCDLMFTFKAVNKIKAALLQCASLGEGRNTEVLQDYDFGFYEQPYLVCEWVVPPVSLRPSYTLPCWRNQSYTQLLNFPGGDDAKAVTFQGIRLDAMPSLISVHVTDGPELQKLAGSITNTGQVDRAYCWTEYFGRISDFSLTINEKLSILSDKQPYDLYKLYKMYAPDSRMSFLTWSQLRQVILIRSDCLALEKGQAVFSPTNLTINMNVKKAIQHTGVAAVQEVKMTLWYFNDAITLSQQAAAVTSMLLSPSDVQTLRVSPEAQEISTLMQMGMQS